MRYTRLSVFHVCASMLFLAMVFTANPSLAERKDTTKNSANDTGCNTCQESCRRANESCQKPCESSNAQCQARCGPDEQCKLRCSDVYQRCTGQCVTQRNECWKGCRCQI
jgi:hypothetical protein